VTGLTVTVTTTDAVKSGAELQLRDIGDR